MTKGGVKSEKEKMRKIADHVFMPKAELSTPKKETPVVSSKKSTKKKSQKKG